MLYLLPVPSSVVMRSVEQRTLFVYLDDLVFPICDSRTITGCGSHSAPDVVCSLHGANRALPAIDQAVNAGRAKDFPAFDSQGRDAKRSKVSC